MGSIVAIDPGVNGAICALDKGTGALIYLDNVPVVKAARKELYLMQYHEILSSFLPVHLAVVEKVTSTATVGAQAAFTFGGSYIAPQCFFTVMQVPYELVSPNVWKKAFGLMKKDKDASRQVATRLYPDAYDKLKNKCDHNKADALLIARYCWMKYNGIKEEVSISKAKRVALKK